MLGTVGAPDVSAHASKPRRQRWAQVTLVLLLLGPLLGLVFPRLDGPVADFVLYQLRIPRVLAGLLVGGGLGLSGAVTQAVFQNPLATPSTTGALAGATLGALAALLFGAGAGWLGLSLVTCAAFCGAMLATLVVVAVAAAGRARKNDVLLVGIAVTLAATAVATALEDLADAPVLVAVSRWSLGHLGQVGYGSLLASTPLMLLATGVQLSLARPLQTLVLGDATAHSRGVAVSRVRTIALLASGLSVATAVAFVGPIVFVGLVVPHLVRLGFGASQRRVLLGSWLGGALFLVTCDALARVVVPGRELPVGVLTAALGAPALAWLVARRK